MGASPAEGPSREGPPLPPSRNCRFDIKPDFLMFLINLIDFRSPFPGPRKYAPSKVGGRPTTHSGRGKITRAAITFPRRPGTVRVRLLGRERPRFGNP